jgi:hypothetical protein
VELVGLVIAIKSSRGLGWVIRTRLRGRRASGTGEWGPPSNHRPWALRLGETCCLSSFGVLLMLSQQGVVEGLLGVDSKSSKALAGLVEVGGAGGRGGDRSKPPSSICPGISPWVNLHLRE